MATSNPGWEAAAAAAANTPSASFNPQSQRLLTKDEIEHERNDARQAYLKWSLRLLHLESEEQISGLSEAA